MLACFLFLVEAEPKDGEDGGMGVAEAEDTEPAEGVEEELPARRHQHYVDEKYRGLKHKLNLDTKRVLSYKGFSKETSAQ